MPGTMAPKILLPLYVSGCKLTNEFRRDLDKADAAWVRRAEAEKEKEKEQEKEEEKEAQKKAEEEAEHRETMWER